MTKKYKGIILAGGSGSRLLPITHGVCKQLIPIYDKPMIYYSISVLMLADIREILIICKPEDIVTFTNLLGDGSSWGLKISYKSQEKPNGIAEAFIIGKDFIGSNPVCLILGDNFFYGQGFSELLQQVTSNQSGATVFGYNVADPQRFGIVEFNSTKKVVSIEEKPKHPKSSYAVTGLYFYDKNVTKYAEDIKPSERGELEITDINNIYLQRGALKVELLGRGFAWLDTGTYDSLLDAGQFVQTIEKRQGYKIACLEEIAYKKKWISKEFLVKKIKETKKNSYYEYIEGILKS